MVKKVQRNINKVSFNNKEWDLRKPVTKIKGNIGWDSETVEGKPFLMANSLQSGNNQLFSDNIDEYLTFISSSKLKSFNNWWYNLNYDMQGLIKMLPYDNIIELSNNGLTTYKEFKIRYIADKVFTIKNNQNNVVNHFDIAQFYNKQPLKSLEHLTSFNKVDVVDIANIDLNRVNNDYEYRNIIIDRCVIDARMTQEVAQLFTDKSNEVVPNNRYYSVASIARAYFLTNLTKKLKLPSKRIMSYGLKSYHGGWIEALKLGTFKNAFNIDIVSAYPAMMANLYSCNGIWTTEPSYIPDTAYSFYTVEIDFYDTDISPLWFNFKEKDYHPNGVIETTLTAMEYEWFIEKGFNVKILAASHLLKHKDHEKPFNNLINGLFDKRMIAKDAEDKIQLIYKLILNSAYGCTINTVKKINTCSLNEWEKDGSNAWHHYELEGDTVFFTINDLSTSMYNPVFASYITAGCRINLLNMIWKHREKVISINTDGAYLKSKIAIKNSDKLGEWSYKKYKELLVVGNGRYFVYNDDMTINLEQSAFRGLRAAKRNMPSVDKQIRDNAGLGVSIDYQRPQKLKECVKGKRIGDINLFQPKTTNISFILDRRLWENKIMNNKDLIDNQINSNPLNVNQIAEAC